MPNVECTTVKYGACGRFPTSTALVGPSQLNPVWVYGFSLRASSALAKREFGHEETGLESVLRARMCIGSRMVSQIVDRASARAGSRRTWNVWGNVDKKRTSKSYNAFCTYIFQHDNYRLP